MTEISFSSNINEKLQVLWQLKTQAIPKARRSALNSTSFYISDEVRKFMENQGDGTWPEAHPLTQLLENKKGKWKRRDRYDGAYHRLAQFARYKINPRSTEAVIGFGSFSARDIRRGKQVELDPKLMKIATEMQSNRTIAVDEAQRKMFGATRGVLDGQPRDDKPGQHFFPLRRGTSLQIAARPVFVPVFSKIGTSATLFTEKFASILIERYEKL